MSTSIERDTRSFSKEERVLGEIGAGFGAKVYLVERAGGEKLAKKVFDPNLGARVAYRAYKLREHPFRAPYAPYVIKGAYELRRIGHRVGRAFNLGVEIVDAVELCQNELGFYSPFIGAVHYSSSNTEARESLDLLERHFSRIGLPTWSFGSYLKEERRKTNALVDEKGMVYVVDYEVGWPYFSRQDIIGFDDVETLKFQRFLTLGQEVLKDRLGDREFLELMRSWEKYQLWSSYWRGEESAPIRKAQLVKEAFGWRSLNERIKLLLEDGKITSGEAREMKVALYQNKDILERVTPHFLVHFGTFIFLRFPFGSIARPSYTAIMRAVDEFRGLFPGRKQERVQIHDLKVILLSAVPPLIPPFNFFAYLTKILGEAPLSYLILDNISFRLTNKGLEEQMEEFGSRKTVKALARLKDGEGIPSKVSRRLMWGIESTMAGLLSREAVEKAGASIRRGAAMGPREGEVVPNEELIQEIESAIEQKYRTLLEIGT